MCICSLINIFLFFMKKKSYCISSPLCNILNFSLCISLKFSTSVVVIGICSHSLQYSTIFRINDFRQILQLFMFHFIFRLEKPRERRWHIERAFKTWVKGPDLKYYIKVFNYRDWGKQCCVADLFWPEPNFSNFFLFLQLSGFMLSWRDF